MKKPDTFLQILVVAVISLFLSSCQKEDENGENSVLVQMEEEVFNLVNAHRASQSLPPLVMNSFIRNEARKHSQNMASGAIPFSHDGYVERFNRIYDELGGSSATENLAYGTTSVTTIFNAWLNSPVHKSDIEGNFTHTGVGVAQDDQGTFFYTQIFLFNP